MPPQLSGVRGEPDLVLCVGVLQDRGEVLLEAGAFQRFGVAAFGEQPDAPAGAVQKVKDG